MSEQLLKKFYLAVVRLLQTRQQTMIDARLASQIKDLLKQYHGRGALSKALDKLGLEDIRVMVEMLLGHDTCLGNEENLQEIYLQYLSSVLPEILSQLTSLYNINEIREDLKNQFSLLQNMLIGVQNQDIFALLHGLIFYYPKLHSQLKQLAASCLQKLGRPVTLALISSLQREEKEMIQELPEVLRELGHLAIPALIVALHYPEEKVRIATVDVLKNMKLQRVANILAESLEDPSRKVRKKAAEALGEIRSLKTAAALEQALQDKHSSVRLEAVKALGKIRSTKSLEPLLMMLNDPNWEVRREAVNAMAQYGPVACGYIAKALENDNLVVKKIASRILADIGTEEAVPALMRAIYDKDISVRERAVIALGRIQGEDSIVPLMFAFEDKAPLVRFAAIQVLVNVGSRATIHLLNKALKDPEPLIRQRANMAMQAILSREENTEE